MSRPVPHTTAPVWPAITPGCLAATIRRNSPRDGAIALLGLPDDTGVRLNHGRPGARDGPRAFRAALACSGAAASVVGALPGVFDAGDIRPGRTLEETHRRVTAALLSAGLFPLAIGGGHDLTFPQVKNPRGKPRGI